MNNIVYDLALWQWCGIIAAVIAFLAIEWWVISLFCSGAELKDLPAISRVFRLLMGRHEQPRDTILRRAAARIYQVIWPAEYEDDSEVTDDNGVPIGDLFPDVPRPVVSAERGSGVVGPGHLHDGDLADLTAEDAETVAQWRDDRDQLAEDPPGPVSAQPPEADGEAAKVAGPGVITATKIGGTWLPLTGQPAPFLVAPEAGELLAGHGWVRGRDFLEYEPVPDDTVIDLRDQPRAGPAAWHQAVRRPALQPWIRDILGANSVDEYLADSWTMIRVRALAATP